MAEGPIKLDKLEEGQTGSGRVLSSVNVLDLMRENSYTSQAANSGSEQLPALQIGHGDSVAAAKIVNAAKAETGTKFQEQPGNFDNVLTQVLDHAGFNLPSTFTSDQLESSLLQNGFTVAGTDAQKAKPGDVVLTFNDFGRGTGAFIAGKDEQSYGLMPQRDGLNEWVKIPNVLETGSRTIVLSPPKS